jgi:hypothetical protein
MADIMFSIFPCLYTSFYCQHIYIVCSGSKQIEGVAQPDRVVRFAELEPHERMQCTIFCPLAES